MTANQLEDQIREIHHTPEDLVEGDLLERLYRVEDYVFTNFPLTAELVEEFNTTEEMVKEYQVLTTEVPAIIVQQYPDGKYTIIDGTHRAKAQLRQGKKTIPAYVGKLK